jgi:hypothetical protein
MRFKLIAALVLCASATAGAQQISSPTAGYLSSTTRFAIPGSAFSSVSSLTDGGLTLSFSATGDKRVAPDGGWASWSQTPDSERPSSGTLDVLYFPTQSLTMTLSRQVGIFGFELEPDPFAVIGFTAQFYRGATLVGSVSRSVDGDAGARLFAYQGGIDRVELSGGSYFAAGAFRYADVPEPSSVVLTVSGLAALVAVRRRRRV